MMGYIIGMHINSLFGYKSFIERHSRTRDLILKDSQIFDSREANNIINTTIILEIATRAAGLKQLPRRMLPVFAKKRSRSNLGRGKIVRIKNSMLTQSGCQTKRKGKESLDGLGQHTAGLPTNSLRMLSIPQGQMWMVGHVAIGGGR